MTRPSNNPNCSLGPSPASSVATSTFFSCQHSQLSQSFFHLRNLRTKKTFSSLSTELKGQKKRRSVVKKLFAFNWHLSPFVLTAFPDATKAIILTASKRTVTGSASFAEILTILLWLWYFVTMRAQSWTFASLFPTCHTSHYLSQSAPC